MEPFKTAVVRNHEKSLIASKGRSAEMTLRSGGLSVFKRVMLVLVAVLVAVIFAIYLDSAPGFWQGWSIAAVLLAIVYVIFARWFWDYKYERVP